MDSHPLSLLPKGFNYYAGGHVHYIFEKNEPEYGLITFPGALFPNNFAELEKYGHGGFYIVEGDKLEWIPIKLFDHVKIELDCEHLTPADVERKLKEEFEEKELKNAILWILMNERQVVEGSGVVGPAAILQGKIRFKQEEKVVVVISGGNIDMELLDLPE